MSKKISYATMESMQPSDRKKIADEGNYDNEWWSTLPVDELNNTLASKVVEIAELKKTDWYWKYIRIAHLEWDMRNIVYAIDQKSLV
jgi:hypothetical protein